MNAIVCDNCGAVGDIPYPKINQGFPGDRPPEGWYFLYLQDSATDVTHRWDVCSLDCAIKVIQVKKKAARL